MNGSGESSTIAHEPPTRTTPAWMRAVYLVCAFVVLVSSITPHLKGGHASTYWSYGLAAAQGTNPYAPNPLITPARFFALGQNRVVQDLNLNPPCLLPLLQVTSHLSLVRFGEVWSLCSAALLMLVVGLLLWDCPGLQSLQLVWLCLFSAVFDTFLGGQIYFVLLLLSTLTWICARRGMELAACIPLGLLVALKPTTAFWPIFLFLSRRRRLSVNSICVSVLTSLVPVVLYGPIVYRQWLSALKNDPHWIIPTDIAVPAYFARMGLKGVGTALAVAMIAWLAHVVWTRKPSLRTTSGIALCATILFAPMAWSDYSIMLAPVFVARAWGKLQTTAALLLMIPPVTLRFLSFSYSRFGFVAMGTPYFAAVWLILISFLRDTRRDGADLPSGSDAVLVATADDWPAAPWRRSRTS